MIKQVICVLVGLIIISFLSCKAPEKPQFKGVQNVEIHALNAREMILSGDFILFNPNTIDVNVNKLDINVYVDEKHIGNIIQTEKTNISSNAQFALPTQIICSPSDIGNNLLQTAVNFLTNKNIMVRYKGSVYIDVLDKEIRLPIDEKSSIKWNTDNK